MQLDKIGLIIILLIMASLLASKTRLAHWITLENFQQHRELLKNYVNQHYLISAIGFILLYIVVAATAIPGAILLSIVGGFLFGVFSASIYVNIGATAGAMITFVTARYIGKDWIEKKYGEKIHKLNREVEEYGKNYLLTLRFIPILPFSLINVFAGITQVSFKTFFWTTALGSVPSSIIYTFAGKNLGDIQSTRDIFSPKIIGIFTALAVFSLVPLIFKKRKRIKTDG
ncbi:MAG: TVP38/TMEM64 family protein [Thermotaleaceae bacterium]